MLFVPHPFLPIYRVQQTVPAEMLQCTCYDVQHEQLLRVMVPHDVIESDDAVELAQVVLDPDGYMPTLDELTWWLAERWTR